jgi:hypothetical protein
MNEPSPDEIAGEVRERFARLAFAPHEEKTFLIGADSAKTLGYDAAELDALPASVTESFAGVGNPFALGGYVPATSSSISAPALGSIASWPLDGSGPQGR